jgi:hypothetical protein
MAYYIFLKSLRSLEEFKKNPHVKIPPKSLSTNFQSLGKLKNLIFNSEFFFLLLARPTLRPTQPLAQPASQASLSPQDETTPRRPIQPVRQWRLCGSTFSLLVRAFRAGRFSLVSVSSGPWLSASSLTSGRLSLAASPPPLGHPALPSSAPRVPPSHYHPAFIPPLIPLLTPPSSMALKQLTPALTPATPPRRSPDPYKRRAPPPDFTAPLPASILLSPCSSIASTERRRLRFCTAIARPPRRLSNSGEALDRTLVSSSSFPCSRDEHP